MGGFTINGCGAGESFYPIRGVGTHFCSHCKQQQPWSVMEARMKIKVFFIPTVTVNTKYVVACDKCNNGFYITQENKDDLLYNRKELKVNSDGVEFIPFGAQTAAPAIDKAPQNTIAANNEIKSREQPPLREEPSPASSAHSVSSSERTNIFTTEKVTTEKENHSEVSSKPAEETKEKVSSAASSFASAVDKRTVKQCPQCRLLFGASKEVCPVCGSTLEIK